MSKKHLDMQDKNNEKFCNAIKSDLNRLLYEKGIITEDMYLTCKTELENAIL